MESKSLDHHEEIPDKKSNKENVEINHEEIESTSNEKVNIDKIIEKTSEDNSKADINKVSNKSDNNPEKDNIQIVNEKTLEENKKIESTSNEKVNIDKIIEKTSEDNSKLDTNKASNKSDKNSEKDNIQIVNEKTLEENKKIESTPKLNVNIDKKINNSKDKTTTIPVKAKSKPVKEPPIEKRPFLEFINDYLIPEIKNEFRLKGKEVNEINLQKTNRPIAEDLCWVIYCEINDTCNFWLSFEKDDITSLKSFSLCKNYEKPSIIESFLIDEKKITLKLIISRILQRLNGQKLIGAN